MIESMPMNCCRASVLAVAVILASSYRAHAQAPMKTPPLPGKSLPGPARVTRSFDATGIQTVVLRAEAADRVVVKTVDGARSVTVSGVPEGGAQGYHPADPNWRETPASRWGLDFQARSFGPTLVISTDKEISYIHHYYHLGNPSITVPPGVKVIKESRKLTGEGKPDLSPPAGR
jgi:hypothetical protein